MTADVSKGNGEPPSEKEAPGVCVACRAIVPRSKMLPSTNPDMPARHAVGGADGVSMTLCGPVFGAWFYHFGFFWSHGTLQGFSDASLKLNMPLDQVRMIDEAKPLLARSVKAVDPESGAPLIVNPSALTISILSWTFVGAK